MNETIKIGRKVYPVIGYVTSPQTGKVPLVDLKMMSDKRWNELAEQNAVENYTNILGHPPDNVEEAVAWQRNLCEKRMQELYDTMQAAWPPPYPPRVEVG